MTPNDLASGRIRVPGAGRTVSKLRLKSFRAFRNRGAGLRRPGVGHHSSGSDVCVEALQPVDGEDLAYPLVPFTQQGYLTADTAQGTFDVLGGVGGQRGLEVFGDPVVVDDVADLFALGGAVDAGRWPGGVRLLDVPVQVEDLFVGGVETGEQHGVDHEEGQRAGVSGCGFVPSGRALELTDAGAVFGRVGPFLALSFQSGCRCGRRR